MSIQVYTLFEVPDTIHYPAQLAYTYLTLSDKHPECEPHQPTGLEGPCMWVLTLHDHLSIIS